MVRTERAKPNPTTVKRGSKRSITNDQLKAAKEKTRRLGEEIETKVGIARAEGDEDMQKLLAIHPRVKRRSSHHFHNRSAWRNVHISNGRNGYPAVSRKSARKDRRDTISTDTEPSNRKDIRINGATARKHHGTATTKRDTKTRCMLGFSYGKQHKEKRIRRLTTQDLMLLYFGGLARMSRVEVKQKLKKWSQLEHCTAKASWGSIIMEFLVTKDSVQQIVTNG